MLNKLASEAEQRQREHNAERERWDQSMKAMMSELKGLREARRDDVRPPGLGGRAEASGMGIVDPYVSAEGVLCRPALGAAAPSPTDPSPGCGGVVDGPCGNRVPGAGCACCAGAPPPPLPRLVIMCGQ
eukprot:4851845-Amphidinium_carterae.2